MHRDMELSGGVNRIGQSRSYPTKVIPVRFSSRAAADTALLPSTLQKTCRGVGVWIVELKHLQKLTRDLWWKLRWSGGGCSSTTGPECGLTSRENTFHRHSRCKRGEERSVDRGTRWMDGCVSGGGMRLFNSAQRASPHTATNPQVRGVLMDMWVWMRVFAPFSRLIALSLRIRHGGGTTSCAPSQPHPPT